MLTVGFARRFATYKRAWLLFSQPERLARLLSDPDRPLQILVAGKAHPADEGGKDVIQHVVDFARDPAAAGRVVFLEVRDDARPPARPGRRRLAQHAAPADGGVGYLRDEGSAQRRLELLDPRRLVAEAYAPAVGFAIGDHDVRATEEEQDLADAEALFAVLEQQILPAYYEQDERKLPSRWIDMMRHSIAELGTQFSTNRMVAEYVERLYFPPTFRRKRCTLRLIELGRRSTAATRLRSATWLRMFAAARLVDAAISSFASGGSQTKQA